jgi:hypothetical protein
MSAADLDFLVLNLRTGHAKLTSANGKRILAELEGVTQNNADAKLHKATGRRLSPRGHWHKPQDGFTVHIVAPRGQ